MKPYYWFQGSAVRRLYGAIANAGPDTCRLEVHEDGNKMTFVVRSNADNAVLATLDDDGCEPINDSHRCPPSC
jgi:hypothetical protein